MPRQLGWQVFRVACFKLSEFQFSGHFTASPGECEPFFQHLMHFYRNTLDEP